MLKKPLNDEWRAWIRLNVARGCSRDELARILLNEGFDFVEVGTELGLTAGSSPAASLPPRLQRDTGPKAAVLTGLQRHGEPLLELYTADQFLDARTCKALVELIKASLRPSTISSQGAPEAAQGQYYEVSQEFKAHTDYFESYELERFSSATWGQRSWTFMVYLNEPQAGGATNFVDAGLSFKPKLGQAVIWNNMDADGQPNPHTLHQGTPVTSGAKAIEVTGVPWCR